ncbi:MAG TPA: nucleotidyltransferase family protein [bacterium]|nr:nucleotidyltransferase family protein [bacterium]
MAGRSRKHRRTASPRRRVAAIILAAGGSRRLGRPKLLIPYQGVPMLQRAVAAAGGAGCAAVLVVLGADRERYRPLLRGSPARVVANPDHLEGMSSSIRAGILALPSAAEAAIIMLADQPRIDAAILRRLIAAYETSGKRIAASRYGPVLGAPVLFDRALFLELLLLEGDQGARQVMETHPADVAAVEIPPAAALDVDLPEDLRGLQGS